MSSRLSSVNWSRAHANYLTSSPPQRAGIPTAGGGRSRPTRRMFRAALTSRSWVAPQSEHSQCLTPSAPIPFGLLSGITPQHEHVWEVHHSSASTYRALCLSAL